MGPKLAGADTAHNAARYRFALPFAKDCWSLSAHRCGGKHKRPFFILAKRSHERIGHENGKIEAPEFTRLLFDADELFDVRMVAPQRGHHGAPPGARGEDGRAHCVPNPHE